MTLEHGGDLVSAQKIYPGEILDMSVNTNPLGPPEEVLRAARDPMQRQTEHPEPPCRGPPTAIPE